MKNSYLIKSDLDIIFNSITVDGEFYSLFKKNNLNHINNVIPIELSSVELLSKCHNTKRECERDKRKGLVVGRVQSGKTTFFLAAVSMAFDNNYDIATIFTGTKNNLKEQTYFRVKKNFHEDIFDNVIILDSSDFLSNKNEGIYDDNLSRSIDLNINSGKKIIIIGLKHYKHIDGLSKILKKVNKQYNHIIIDDEGDQATLNSKIKKEEMSTTYKSFVNLQDKLNKVSFISVTATPQANLFIDTYDILSPEFSVLVEPGEGYIGAQYFHSDLENQLVKVIPDIDKEDVLNAVIPPSLKQAIRMFALCCAIQTKRNKTNQKIKVEKKSMLIHPSFKQNDHTNVKNLVDTFVEYLKEVIDMNKKDPVFKDEILKFRDVYYDMNDDFDYEFNFEDIIDILKHEINFLGVQIVNSAEDYESSTINLFKNIIYIGGNMVERGLTIENLMITYITRHPKNKVNIDTLLQRARWFGYKKDYIDLCRVYCVNDIKDAFSKIYSHEIQLWEKLTFANKHDINLKDYVFDLELFDKNLRITRSSVLSENVYEIYYGNVKQKTFLLDTELQKDYTNFILNIFSYPNNYTIIKHKNEQEDFQKILSTEELQIFINYVVERGLVEEKIKKWLFKLASYNQEIKLYLMRRKIKNTLHQQVRTFDDMYIRNLMQGPSLKGSKIYPGDNHVYEKEKHIQIHLIKPRNKIPGIDIIPYIAINIPFSNGTHVAERR